MAGQQESKSGPVDETARESMDLEKAAAFDAAFRKSRRVGGPAFITSELGQAAPGSISQDVDRLIRENRVLVFSKSTCPFCFELKRTLTSLGVAFNVVEIDELGKEKMGAIQDHLHEAHGMRTVPHLFVDGESLQGCRDSKTLQHSGEFYAKLANHIPYESLPQPDDARVRTTGLFYFPHTVNDHVIRGVSLCAVITCVFLIVFRDARAAPWCALGLAIDYMLRFLGGAAISPIGMIVTTVASAFKPKWAAGPPKQFAAFCGTFLSTLAAALFLAGYPTGGAVVLGGLLGAAGLEAILGFCLGCWMFGMAIRFKILPPNVYRYHLNNVDDTMWAYNWSHKTRDFPQAVNTRLLLPGQFETSEVDLVRKNRWRKEYKLEDVDPIRHMKVSYFLAPMATTALGLLFRQIYDGFDSRKYPGEERGQWIDPELWEACTVGGVVLYAFMLMLYAARFVGFPHKVMKDFKHPEYHGGFSAICITAMLIAITVQDEDGSGSSVHVLLWIGAGAQMLLTLLRIADMIYERNFELVLSPISMITPVGTLVGALGIGTFADDDGTDPAVEYREFAIFWYAIGALFGLVLFTLSFRKAVLDHWSDARARTGIWIWLATFSIAGPAFMAINETFVGDGIFYQGLWGIASFLLLLCLEGCRRSFFNYTDSRSNFIYAFSLTAYAMSSYQFYSVQEDRFSRVVAIASIALAAAVGVVCGLHLFTELVNGTLFTPAGKWGPASFTDLSHESFRFALPKYGKVINAADASKPGSILAAARALEEVCFIMAEHSSQEEEVIFKYVRRFFPALKPALNEEHDKMHALADQFEEIAKDLKAGSNVGAHVNFIKSKYDGWVKDTLAHLRHEEATLGPVLRKYFPRKLQVEMIEEVWSHTSGEAWHRLLPFCVKNLPHPKWKVRYVKTITWAMPERCHEVGLILYRGLDSATWTFLADKMPEIVPRGVAGYRKIY